MWVMTSTISSLVTPLWMARATWPRNCSLRFIATSAATVIRLRSRFDSGPVDGVIAGLPDELEDLKGPLGAITQGQPRIVLVLGEALTESSTVTYLRLVALAGG